MYKIEFSKTAQKQLFKLEKKMQERIINTLDRIRIRPYSHIKRLIGCPYFRVRVGEYRIILDIKKDALIIFVIEIGHRKNIYKVRV